LKHQFLKELDENGIEILGDIPLDDDIVNSYCQGKPLMDNNGDFNRNGAGFRAFSKIFENLKKWLNIK